MPSELYLISRRFSGKLGSQKQAYSTTFSYTPVEDTALDTRGNIYMVIDLKNSSSQSIDLAMNAKIIFDAVVESYYAPSDLSPMASLETAVHSGKKRFEHVSQGSEDKVVGDGVVVNLVAAVVWRSYLYVVRMGDVSSSLVRGDRVEEVGEGNGDFITTASGKLTNNDIFILGSSVFKKMLPSEEIVQALPSLIKNADSLSEESKASNDYLSVNNAFPVDFSVVLLEVKNEEEVPVVPVPDVMTVEEEIINEVSEGEEVIPQTSTRKLNIKKINPVKPLVSALLYPISALAEKFKPRPAPIYIRREIGTVVDTGRGSSRVLLISAILLLILFVGSVIWTIQKRRARVGNSVAIVQIDKAKENINKARELVDLNNSRAREFLKLSQDSLDEARKVVGEGVKNDDIENLAKEINEINDKVNKVVRLDNPTVYYDLASQDKEVQPTALVGSSSLLVTDLLRGIVYKIAFLTDDTVPSIEKISDDKIKGIKFAMLGSGMLYGVTDSGMVSISLVGSNVSKSEIKIPISFTDIIAADSYGDGLYFVGRNSQVYRVGILSGSFLSSQDWLSVPVDLVDARSLTIDGDLYITRAEKNDVVKLVTGSPVEWSLRDMDKPLSKPSRIYTTIESQFLYIGDPGNKRVVVVTKDGGLYNRQFVYTGNDALTWTNLQDLWVDETTSSIYILDGTRVYRVKY